MASPCRVVFNADTGQYVAQVDAATGAVSKQAQAVADAKNKSIEWTKTLVESAKAAGASSEELARIVVKSARESAKITEDNVDRQIAALQRRMQAEKDLQTELAAFKTTGITSEAGHGTEITDRMRASALLRGGGLRAGENFASQFDIFNKISGIAFPILGATMLGSEVLKAAEAFAKLWKESSHAAEKITADYAAIHDKAQISIDDKEIENQKIQDQIDKISGHPNNGLAMALLEAKKMADQLVASLQEDRKQLEALLKEHDTGKFGMALSVLGIGPQTTGIQGDELLADQQGLIKKVEDLRSRLTRAMSVAPDDAAREAATKAFNNSLHSAFQSQIDAYTTEAQRLKDAQAAVHVTATRNGVIRTHEGHGPQIANVEGRAKRLQDLLASQTLDESIYAGNKTLGGAKQKKEDDAAAKAAAKAAEEKKREAARKAMEAQRKDWSHEDDVAKVSGTDTADAEAARWKKRVDSLTVGSEQYIFAFHEFAEKSVAAKVKDAELLKQADEKAQKNQRAAWDLDHDSWETAAHRTAADQAAYWKSKADEAIKGSDNERAALDKAAAATLAAQKALEEADKARSKASLEKGQQQTRYAEAVLGIQVMTGAISRQDAAMQQANIHAEQYRQQIEALRLELKRQTALDPNSGATIGAHAAMDKADADRQVQIIQDAAAMAAASWQGALKNANRLWIQDSQDSARQVVQLYQSALNGVNQNIVSFLTEKHGHGRHTTDWKGLGKNLAKEGTGDLLKYGESTVMKGLGLAKADGSRGSPLYVYVMNLAGMGGGPAGAGANALSSAMNLSGNKTADAIAAIGDGLSFIPGASMFTGLFGGHRALGGGVKAGVTYDVGEMGREEFTPDSDGTITPTNRLGNNAASYTVNVANGVTPEQMRMHVREALSAFHPVVVASAVTAVKANQGRNPASRN